MYFNVNKKLKEKSQLKKIISSFINDKYLISEMIKSIDNFIKWNWRKFGIFNLWPKFFYDNNKNEIKIEHFFNWLIYRFKY